MKSSLQLQHWLDFLLAMTEKEIKARYKRAILGFFWLLINPVSQMLVMGFIFQFFVPVKIDNYFLFLFAGLLPWNFFAQSLTKATPVFYYERNLIKKAKFPKEVLVLSIVLANFFHFLIALILLIIVLIGDKIILEAYDLLSLIEYLGRISLLLPSILILLLFTSAFSLLTASLNVRFRDVNFIVQLGINLLFYGTPIVYTLKLLPEYLQPIFYLNPLTLIIELFQHALLKQSVTVSSLATVSLVMILLMVYMAFVVFKKENESFDDWL